MTRTQRLDAIADHIYNIEDAKKAGVAVDKAEAYADSQIAALFPPEKTPFDLVLDGDPDLRAAFDDITRRIVDAVPLLMRPRTMARLLKMMAKDG